MILPQDEECVTTFSAIFAGAPRAKSPMDPSAPNRIYRRLARRVSRGGSALVIGPHWKGGDDLFRCQGSCDPAALGNCRRRRSVVLTLRVRTCRHAGA